MCKAPKLELREVLECLQQYFEKGSIINMGTESLELKDNYHWKAYF